MRDLSGKRLYCKMKNDALDRILCGTRFGKGYGPVVRQTGEWMKTEFMEVIQSCWCMKNSTSRGYIATFDKFTELSTAARQFHIYAWFQSQLWPSRPGSRFSFGSRFVTDKRWSSHSQNILVNSQAFFWQYRAVIRDGVPRNVGVFPSLFFVGNCALMRYESHWHYLRRNLSCSVMFFCHQPCSARILKMQLLPTVLFSEPL